MPLVRLCLLDVPLIVPVQEICHVRIRIPASSPKEGTPGNNADVCVNNANLIGRLPWRTLGLPGLTAADGWGKVMVRAFRALP